VADTFPKLTESPSEKRVSWGEVITGPRLWDGGQRVVQESCQREVFPVLDVGNVVFQLPEGHDVHGSEYIARWGQTKVILGRAETPAGVKEGNQNGAEARENLVIHLGHANRWALKANPSRKGAIEINPGDSVIGGIWDSRDDPRGGHEGAPLAQEVLSEERGNDFRVGIKSRFSLMEGCTVFLRGESLRCANPKVTMELRVK